MDIKVWRSAVSTFLLPRLPGGWQSSGWAVHRGSDGWFSQSLLASISWSTLKMSANVQFLAVPKEHWVARVSLDLGPRWTAPTTVEEAEPMMSEIAQLIPRTAVPFFDEQATLTSRLSHLCRHIDMLNERLDGSGFMDVNVDEELVYVHLLRGDLDGAAEAAQWSERAAALESRPWAAEVNNRVQRVAAAARRDPDEALEILGEQAAWTRKALRIPAPIIDLEST